MPTCRRVALRWRYSGSRYSATKYLWEGEWFEANLSYARTMLLRRKDCATSTTPPLPSPNPPLSPTTTIYNGMALHGSARHGALTPAGNYKDSIR